MKIEADKLKKFIKKTTLDALAYTCLLEFTDEGLKTKVVINNVAMIKGVLNKNAFIEYESIGEVGIKSVSVFSSMLDYFTGKQIKLSIEDNKLKIVSESGSSYFVLCEKTFVENYMEKEPSLAFDEGFELSNERLNKIKKACDILHCSEATFEVINNKLVLSVINDVKDEIKEETTVAYHDARSRYGELMLKAVGMISNNARVSFNNDYPLRLHEVDAEGTITYIIAPLSED